MMGLREQLLAVADCERVPMDVPEWQAAIYVRGLTLDERTSIADEANGLNGASDASKNNVLTRRLVLYGVCDDSGNRVFQDEDFAALGRRNANVLDRIALRISGLSKLDAKSVGELEKNSEATQTADSASS